VAGGFLALIESSDQMCLLRADLTQLPTAIEEMVRWTSPSPSKRRTATRDVALGDCEIKAGDKVQIWEGSANRDSAVFNDPDAFDIARKPNPHLGFGQGIHYCLGANLARLELRVLFEELLTRYSSARLVKPVEWTRSNRHTGIRHLVVELR
jgi:cytochrome P450